MELPSFDVRVMRSDEIEARILGVVRAEVENRLREFSKFIDGKVANVADDLAGLKRATEDGFSATGDAVNKRLRKLEVEVELLMQRVRELESVRNKYDNTVNSKGESIFDHIPVAGEKEIIRHLSEASIRFSHLDATDHRYILWLQDRQG